MKGASQKNEVSIKKNGLEIENFRMEECREKNRNVNEWVWCDRNEKNSPIYRSKTSRLWPLGIVEGAVMNSARIIKENMTVGIVEGQFCP